MTLIQTLTSIRANEFDIIAIKRLSRTIILMILYVPNIKSPQNLVYDLMPCKSKFSSPTTPKLAQNKDWDDSNKLNNQKICYFYLLGKYQT